MIASRWNTLFFLFWLFRCSMSTVTMNDVNLFHQSDPNGLVPIDSIHRAIRSILQSTKRKIIPRGIYICFYQFYIHSLFSRCRSARRYATFSSYILICELSVEPEMRNEGNRPSFSANDSYCFSNIPYRTKYNEPRPSIENSPKLLSPRNHKA